MEQMTKLPTYADYILSRENNANLFEMPVPPTSFKDRDTGEFGDDVHVSTNAPMFMDREDIYYLYQFPRKYWTDAMYARYNRYLPQAKENPNFNDIQDVVITGHRGVRLVFHNRNTFAKHLVDKIERTVDVDHFKSSNKTPQDYQQHQELLAKHRQNKVDMGGYMGATLSDPKRFKPNEDADEVLVFRGMVAPNKEVVGTVINKWMQGSSEGWLADLSKREHQRTKVKAAGGRGGGSELATFTGKSLDAIQAKMKEAGAVPFETDRNHMCVWPNVTVEAKSGTKRFAYFGGEIENPIQGSPLPVLFPGKEIHSHDIHAHENEKKFLEKLKSMKGSDLQQIRGDLPAEIKALEDEIIRRDLARNWETEDQDESDERSDMLVKIENLKSLNDYRSWFKNRHPGVEITPEAIDKSLGEYQDVLKQKMQDRQLKSRKYDAYDWNVHRFNRSRNPHDPLNVGMGNPTKFGSRKYENITRGKTTGFGTFWPNRQSPSLIHGNKGDWEDKFKPFFGHGHDEVSNSFNLKSTINKVDQGEIERDTKTYLTKLAEKLIHNDEVINAFKLADSSSRNDAKMAFTNSKALLDLLRQHFTNVKLDKNGNISSQSSQDIPQILKIAYAEIKSTENNLAKIKEESEGESTNESAIATGVDRFLKSRYLAAAPDLHFAMNAQRIQLIHNAEDVVRRMIGDSAFRHFSDNQAKGVKGTEKYQQIIDLKAFIENASYNYAVRISQLDFGAGTRRERDKMGRIGRKTVSSDAPTGENGKSSAGEVPDSATRRTAGEQDADPRIVNGVEGFNKRRLTRPSSDADTHVIGHNVKALYDAAVSQLTQKAGGVTAGDKKMLSGICTDIEIFRLEKAKLEKAALEAGEELEDRELDKRAYANAIETLKKGNFIPKDYTEPNAADDMKGFAHDLKHRVDNELELDSDEQEAAKIISLWQDQKLSPSQVQLKLNDITVLAKKTRNDQSRRIADLLLLMHGRQPELGSFNNDRVAASATGKVLPGVEFNAQQSSEIRDSLQKITADVERLRREKAQQKATAPAPAAVAPAPMAPVQTPAPPVPPRNPLGAMIRRNKQ